jgi:two-component system, cell cycle sensor histidine kinase and response regulator CckA
VPPLTTILLVDDEPSVLDLLGRTLRRAGFAVVSMATPSEALEWWAGHRDEVGLVVSDVVMPGMSGLEMVSAMRGDRPDVPALFISGYPNRVPRSALGDLAPVLQKPFTSQELIAAVNERINP